MAGTMTKRGKAKRDHSNSPSAAIRTAQDAAKNETMPLMPPAGIALTKDEMPFWKVIINARAREFWTEYDLVYAASLAKILTEIAKLEAELKKEGGILITGMVTKTTKTPKGNTITVTRKGADNINPRHALIDTLQKRAVMLGRMIHVHASATSGSPQDEINKNASARKAAKSETKTDPLIARPTFKVAS
jgi:hypothetical protein